MCEDGGKGGRGRVSSMLEVLHARSMAAGSILTMLTACCWQVLREAFEAAVEKRLMSDVPFGERGAP